MRSATVLLVALLVTGVVFLGCERQTGPSGAAGRHNGSDSPTATPQVPPQLPATARPAAAVAQAPPQPASPGASAAGATQKRDRSAVLRSFLKLSGKSEAERLEGLLGLLREELADPAEPGMGMGGGPIDHGYELSVLLSVIGSEIARGGLLRVYEREHNSVLRELLAIALVEAGDRERTDVVRELALRHAEGAVRQGAMHALAKQKDIANRGTFEAGLKDRYSRIGGLERPGEGPHKVYPVRTAAAEGMRTLGLPQPDAALEVPLKVRGGAAMLAQLLTDKDPTSCRSGVHLLAKLGKDGVPYLRAFVRENGRNAALAEAITAARQALK